MDDNTVKQEAPKGRPCPKDCEKCTPWQQMYCCTKMVFDLSKDLQSARQEVAQLKGEVTELKGMLPTQAVKLSKPSLDNKAQ